MAVMLSHLPGWTVSLALLLISKTARCQILLTSGRVTGASDGAARSLPLILSWAGDSVQVAFESSDTVTAGFQSLADSSNPSAVLFRFTVDGNAEQQQIAVPQGAGMWSKGGLSAGQHSLTVTRLNEGIYGPVSLANISLAPTGRFIAPSRQPSLSSGRRILFLGDSITSGWGANGDGSCGNFQLGSKSLLGVNTQDVAITYPWLVASAFSADPQIVAWTGAFQNPFPSWESAKLTNIFPPTIPQLWHESIADNASSQADLSAWLPQVVVMAGGANDFGADPPLAPMSDWVAQYIAFIKEVQSTYASSLTTTVVVSWSRAQLDVPLPDAHTENYLQYQAALGQAIQEQGLPGTYFLQLNADGMPLTGWCAAHPNPGAHAVIASQVEAFLRQKAPSWASASFPATAQAAATSFVPATSAG